MSVVSVTYFVDETRLDEISSIVENDTNVDIRQIGDTIGVETTFLPSGARLVVTESIINGEPIANNFSFFDGAGNELVRIENFLGAFLDNDGSIEYRITYATGDTEIVGLDFLLDSSLFPADLSSDDADGIVVDLGDGIDTLDLTAFDRNALNEVVGEDGTISLSLNNESVNVSGLDRVELQDGTYLYNVEGELSEYLYGVYAASLARTPDEPGFNFWNDTANASNLSKAEIAEFFIDSPEFASLFDGEISDIDYISALYNTVLGRNADDDGFGFWLGVFESGEQSRADMLVFFVCSDEYRETYADDVDDGIWVL
ncbi:MAG: DUF4214 domain-containing protein [Pseudomonadota bacterium]